ncbi:MAG: insulinase family protein [Bacteroidaceae bacterium]|nr:insulinase family protein [Bacteroidaceae bacterium]
MKNLKMMLLALLSLAAMSMSAQQMPPLPIDEAVRYGKLPNGLTYYIRHNEEPRNQANFYIAQKVGAVQEEESQRGLAHFLEHMAFNGSVTFPADGQLIKACERMGVKFGQNLNAYTAADETVYNIDDVPVTPENIDTCLWILHDWADGLLLTAEEINKERGVIHEEWRMRSSATQRIFNRRLPELYPGSRYGERMPIGLMSVIDNFEPDFLRAYYEKWYRPDLQGIIVVGDINVDEIEQKIKTIFGTIQMPENAAAYEFYPVPDNNEPIYVIDKDKELPMAMMSLSFKQEILPFEMRGTMAKPMQDYMTSVICQVLNERLSDLSKKPGCPFVQAGVNYGTYIMSKTCDALDVEIVPQPGKDVEAVKVVMQEVERARRYGLTDSEVLRAREEFLSRMEKIYDNRDKQKNDFYVQQYVRHFLEGDAIPSIETEYQVYKMVAPQLPTQVFSMTLAEMTASVDTNFVFFALYPEKEDVRIPEVAEFKTAMAEARAAELEAFVDNVKNEPLVAKMPKPVKVQKETPADYGFTCWTLKNGARVFFKQTDFNNSEVLVSASSKGGLSLVPQQDMLSASVMDDVMNSCGWGNFTSSELEKALAGKQASLGVSISETGERLGGKSTPKDLRTLFELAYLKFQPVKDDPDAFRNLMDGLRIQLENVEKNPMKSFQDSIQKGVYCGNPRKINLKLADLDKIDYKTCQRIYKERFQSAGDFDFYVVGAFSVDSLRTYVEQYIAPLPAMKKRESYNKANVTRIEPGQRTIRYNREMETPQAYTMQLWSGDMPYSSEQACVVEATGAALDQMLLKTIREDGGMAYSVSASGSANFGVKEDYALQIVAPFTPAKVDSVLLLMQEGIDEIAKNGVAEKYINDYKQFELKQLEESQRNNSYWMQLISTKNNWGRDLQAGAREAIEGVTSAKIQQFVKDYLLKQHNVVKVTMLPADLTETE